MTILIITWIISGVLAGLYFLYDVATTFDEILLSEVLFSILLFVFGYISLGAAIFLFIINLDKIKDFAVWRRK